MGAWGPAIFSDDTACDVRDGYRELIAEGVDSASATDQMIEMFDELDDEDEDKMVFWLALAATQSRLGRLQDRVRDRAIEVIDSGRDLLRWEETGLGRKRQQHLEKLKRQLLGPQPAPKKPRVEKFYTPDISVGQFIGYRLKSGRLAVFFVEDVDDQTCVFSALDWTGDEFPSATQLMKLPKKKPVDGYEARVPDPQPILFSLYTQKKRGIPHDRLAVLDVEPVEPDEPYTGGALFWEWGDSLDGNLEFYFGWT